MAGPFRRFVILAGMRTGSNYLERLLSQFDAIACHGELFNPAFIGKRDRCEYLGFDMAARERDPMALLEAVVAQEPERLHGFRLFDDHDSRVLDATLDDPTTAKVLLRRDPVHSFVSLRIAKATDQWMLGNAAKRRSARIRFDRDAYAAFRSRRDAFENRIMTVLKETGQTPFVIDYTDLKSGAIINGLAQFIGADQSITEFEEPIKRQNPEGLAEKVENFDQMREALAGDIALEDEQPAPPPRGPSVPNLITANTRPILFAPIPGNPTGPITDWFSTLGGYRSGHNRTALNAWLDEQPGHIAFTYVDHPLSRAWRAFMRRIVSTGDGSYRRIRRRLAKHHGLALPDDPSVWPAEERARSFEAFLQFLKANIAGQTGIRIDADWAPQDEIVAGFSAAIHLHVVVRPGTPVSVLETLLGSAPPSLAAPPGLAAVYSKRIENLARSAYAHDYRKFGFSDWVPTEATASLQ